MGQRDFIADIALLPFTNYECLAHGSLLQNSNNTLAYMTMATSQETKIKNDFFQIPFMPERLYDELNTGLYAKGITAFLKIYPKYLINLLLANLFEQHFLPAVRKLIHDELARTNLLKKEIPEGNIAAVLPSLEVKLAEDIKESFTKKQIKNFIADCKKFGSKKAVENSPLANMADIKKLLLTEAELIVEHKKFDYKKLAPLQRSCLIDLFFKPHESTDYSSIKQKLSSSLKKKLESAVSSKQELQKIISNEKNIQLAFSQLPSELNAAITESLKFFSQILSCAIGGVGAAPAQASEELNQLLGFNSIPLQLRKYFDEKSFLNKTSLLGKEYKEIISHVFLFEKESFGELITNLMKKNFALSASLNHRLRKQVADEINKRLKINIFDDLDSCKPLIALFNDITSIITACFHDNFKSLATDFYDKNISSVPHKFQVGLANETNWFFSTSESFGTALIKFSADKILSQIPFFTKEQYTTAEGNKFFISKDDIIKALTDENTKPALRVKLEEAVNASLQNYTNSSPSWRYDFFEQWLQDYREKLLGNATDPVLSYQKNKTFSESMLTERQKQFLLSQQDAPQQTESTQPITIPQAAHSSSKFSWGRISHFFSRNNSERSLNSTNSPSPDSSGAFFENKMPPTLPSLKNPSPNKRRHGLSNSNKGSEKLPLLNTEPTTSTASSPSSSDERIQPKKKILRSLSQPHLFKYKPPQEEQHSESPPTANTKNLALN